MRSGAEAAMSGPTPIVRLGVIDRGEAAVRLFNAVGELNHAGDGAQITTVLLHRDAEPQPWYGREADDVRRLATGTGAPAAADIVAALQRAQVDTLWLGQSPCPRAELLAACAAAGIAVVGPDAAAVRRLDEPGALEALHAGGARPAAGAPLRRIEVDILADAHGTVWVFGERDVTVRRDGWPLLVEAPCVIDAGLAQRIRAAAGEIARAVRYRGAGVLHVAHDGAGFAVEGFDTVA
jgi:acetyl/propionyl-CoA carboxylase alpha subunit